MKKIVLAYSGGLDTSYCLKKLSIENEVHAVNINTGGYTIEESNKIKDKAIKLESDKGVSRGRAKKHQSQKSKGRRKGAGSRKGKANARLSDKQKWMNKIRLQRQFLNDLKSKDKLEKETYKDLYRKAKGGFFRSKRHVKLYITEHKLVKNGK